MTYNPYAAPQAPPPPPPPGGAGQPYPFTASDALTIAWARFKEHGVMLVLSYTPITLGIALIGQIPGALTLGNVVEQGSPAYFAVLGVSYPLMQALSAFFQVGFARMWLDAARGTPPRFETLFSGADRFLPLLGLNILLALGFVVGCALFIVPGVLLLMLYQLAPFYVVEGRLGPIEALRETWAATAGQRGELFVLSLAGMGLALLGFSMCCVGIAATIPLYMVATAVAFTRVSGIGVAMAPPPQFPGEPPAPLPPWT